MKAKKGINQQSLGDKMKSFGAARRGTYRWNSGISCGLYPDARRSVLKAEPFCMEVYVG